MALEAVQAQAGHRSIESTRIYLHLTNDWLAGEYRRAADADRRRPGRSGGDARRAGRWLPDDCAIRIDAAGGIPSRTRVGEIAATGPQVAATMGRYLAQAATFLAPSSVDVADNALRQFARWLARPTPTSPPSPRSHRDDIEDFKVWLAAQPGNNGASACRPTRNGNGCGMLRVFFERIIEWDWPDAPHRNPIIGRDIPTRPEPLPKFLDDRDAARLMAAARAATDPRDRLVVEVLARTGLRAGELCDLDADAVVRHRRRPLAARPRRQAPQRPLRPAAPRTRRAARRLDRRQPRTHPPPPPPRRRPSRHPRPSPRRTHRPPRRPQRRRATSTPTSSATPSPPKPSTEACASKRSPRCSGTARCT